MRPFSREKTPLPPDFRPLALDFSRPVDVEIGCGAGLHPLQYARAHPERQLVAFERTKEKFEKFAGRLAHHEALPNLIAIHGDALSWITHGLPEESVDRYFLLYPNPYPKESQRNLRFHQMPFFAWLKRTLKVGGELYLATNEAWYAQEAEVSLVEEWGLELLERRLLPPGFPARTHFERKYLARGMGCWDLRLRR